MARLNNFNNPGRGVLVNRAHPLARGLVGCWLMNEGTGERVFDHSGYGNHGVMTNMDATTDWVYGQLGGALNFDGVNDYIICGNSSSLQITTQTISAWICPTSINYGYIYGSRDASKGGGSLLLSLERIYFSVGTTWPDLPAMQYITNNVWTYVAASFDAVNAVLDYYINGLHITTSTNSGSFNHTVTKLIGNRYNAGPPLLFDGSIANVMLYNRALSAPEIMQLYKNPYCFLQPPTSSRYRSQRHRHYNYKRVRR